MRSQKPPYTGVLLKKIHLDDAKPRGLRAAFAFDPDTSDFRIYIQHELGARYAALDKFFKLKTSNGEIWEKRAKALLSRHFDIEPNDPQWWHTLTSRLTQAYIPGFSVKLRGDKKHGAPQEWDFKKLAQLFADVEFLKRKRKRKKHFGVRKICNELPKTTGYKQRWGRYRGEVLRKAYARANKLRRCQFMFLLTLSGGDALIPAKGIDRVAAAIERHALKI